MLTLSSIIFYKYNECYMNANIFLFKLSILPELPLNFVAKLPLNFTKIIPNLCPQIWYYFIDVTEFLNSLPVTIQPDYTTLTNLLQIFTSISYCITAHTYQDTNHIILLYISRLNKHTFLY